MRIEIPGTQYSLDRDGNIYSPSGNRLWPRLNKKGFVCHNIYDNDKNQKYILVHIEVWRAFNGAIPPGGIKHENGDKTDNCYLNLVAKYPAFYYLEFIKQGISITKVASFFKQNKKHVSEYVAKNYPGGIRALRKKYPLNSNKDISEKTFHNMDADRSFYH